MRVLNVFLSGDDIDFVPESIEEAEKEEKLPNVN